MKGRSRAAGVHRAAETSDTACEVLGERGRRPRVRVFGAWFDNVTMAEAISDIDELTRQKEPAVVVTPNLDHVVRMRRDTEYARFVSRANLVLADGQPIVWESYLLGTPLKEKVSGADLFPRLCEHSARAGHRVFFLGGEAGAAEGARVVLERRYPGLNVVGTHCPRHGFEWRAEDDRAAVEAVRRGKPDILFVGLGSPRQERWIARNLEECGAKVGIGVGIAFSFVCGRVRRAPRGLQRLGLEWAYRLCREPRRLWRRYLRDAVAMVPMALGDLAHARGSTARTGARRLGNRFGGSLRTGGHEP